MDALDLLGRATSILFALALTGAPFLLWARSKAAALLGALAGVAALFFELVFIGLRVVAESGGMPPGSTQVLFATAGILQAIVTYVPLAIMVFLLARRRAA
jgi:hypothetical protein